jgi:hypothetical protein
MGHTFGHFDKNATTTNDQGQSMHDAYGGLSDSQQRNRALSAELVLAWAG